MQPESELQEAAALFEGIECSLEGGITLARRMTQRGSAYHSGVHDAAEKSSPDHILFGGVYQAVSGYVRDPQRQREWLTNFQIALMQKHGELEGRDFALGVLTEVVRQAEDGYPDAPNYGDSGILQAHGTASQHVCLLENKAKVEPVIYDISLD